MKAHPLGADWERLAERFLRGRGLRLIQRNFHCRLGEIDLVMLDEETVVFVEVRYRNHSAFGSAPETVDFRKRLRMQRAASVFLCRRPHLATRICRFDVVGVRGSRGRPRFQWLPGAFDAA